MMEAGTPAWRSDRTKLGEHAARSLKRDRVR